MGNIKLFCLYSNYLHIFIIAVKSRKTTFSFCFFAGKLYLCRYNKKIIV